MTSKAHTNEDREIRVFISSTFRDMHAERDYLVSHVFPVIRRACRERQVEFTEIDLRWGVTKEDAEQGKVVRICLEEINRCRPYFLSLLGERYGWSPIAADLEHKAELFALFPFLEKSLKVGLSVTEMEILHGVLDNPEMTEHCFFYLRDKALSHSLADSLCAPQDYFETDQHLQAKLDDLKHQVRSSGLPVRDNYASIEALAELIKQDLLAVLDTQFPEEQTPTPLIAEQNAHRSYAQERCQAYIANLRDIEVLDKHLNTVTNHALLITGESGLGKSALLAYWLNQQRLIKPEQFIIEHYVGISGDADPVAIIRRIMAEIKHRNHDSEDLPSKPEEIIRDFPLWLAKISERDPLLLIIDGLNQLENKAGLWLPSFWQENVKAIFSVIPGEQLAALSQRDWPVHSLEALDIKRRVQLIGDWLASYRKALSTEQAQLIAKAPQTGNPLFLKTVLEELRIFGYFEQLDQRIATLLSANNPQQLFILVLARLESDFGKDIVTQIMQALWAARRGLSETEIAGITGLSRLVISTFLMAIDAHVAKKSGLLNFFHEYLRLAVKRKYLTNPKIELTAHKQLALYFDQKTELDMRMVEELPWQWQLAEEWEELKDCICAIPMFEEVYKNKYELLGYWLSLRNRYDVGESYLKTVEQLSQEISLSKEDQADILNKIGLFLNQQCACYMSSEIMHRKALDIHEQFLAYDNQNIGATLNNLALLLLAQGKYSAAEIFFQRALIITEKRQGIEHIDTAYCLNNLALLFLEQGKYTEAEPLFRKALEIRERLLGILHPDTILSLNNLAVLLDSQGCIKESEIIYRKALAINEKLLQTNSPEKAIIMRNLAALLTTQGILNEAEQLNLRALEIFEQVYGGEHPDIAICLNNLGVLRSNEGNYLNAELLHHSALAILEKVLGAVHPYIITTLNLIGSSAQEQGKYHDAEFYLQKALNTCENISDNEKPYTSLIETSRNLGMLHLELGKFSDAEKCFRRALEVQESFDMLAPSDKVRTLDGLARSLQFQGKYSAAEKIFRESLEISEQVLGAEHINTALILNNLAVLLYSQDNYSDAEPIYRKALFIREKVLGVDHPVTAASLDNLAVLLIAKGDYAEAESLNLRALNIYEKVHGYEHPATARSLNNLAGLYFEQGNYTNAEKFFRKALVIQELSLGVNHPDTAGSMFNLGGLFDQQGNYSKAEQLYRRAYTVMKKVYEIKSPNTSLVENKLKKLLNGPLSNRELLWKQADFISAAAYAKSFTLLSGQTSLTFSSLLLGAKTANLEGRLEKPIEALSKYESQIQEAENNLGLTAEQILIPIHDRAMPMDEELKILLQDYRQSTLECLVDALIDQVL